MCPDREILSAWLDGEIDSPWDRALEEHVGSCPDCRARLERLEGVRRSLLESPMPDWRPAMERVRSSLVSRGLASEKTAPVWRRRVSLPVPLAVAAALLVMVLAGALAVSVVRSSFGLVRITRQGSGGTEIRIDDLTGQKLELAGAGPLTRLVDLSGDGVSEIITAVDANCRRVAKWKVHYELFIIWQHAIGHTIYDDTPTFLQNNINCPLKIWNGIRHQWTEIFDNSVTL